MNDHYGLAFPQKSGSRIPDADDPGQEDDHERGYDRAVPGSLVLGQLDITVTVDYRW